MNKILNKLANLLLSVPVRIKVFGIMLIPIVILGISLNYWVNTGLSDWLSYLLPNESVTNAMQAGSRSVFLVSIIAGVAALLLSMILMILLTKPLEELRETAHEVKKGNLKSRANIWARDEIGEVAAAFNEMVDHLVESQNALKESNKKLSLMNKIILEISKENEIHDTLFTVLKHIVESFNFINGWIYLYSTQTDKFHLATWYDIPDRYKGQILDCDPDELCTCQKQLLDHKWNNNYKVDNCTKVQSKDKNTEIYHVTVHLKTKDHPFGIILLQTQKERRLSQEEAELLSLITSQITEYISKSWLEEQLKNKEKARRKLMKALIKAQEDERIRLAAELHDGAGQMLTSLSIRMKALERDIEDKEISNKVSALCKNVSDITEYIRYLSYQNRPILIEELGLTDALDNLIADIFSSSGISWDSEIILGDISLPKEIETLVYRITQECLTNILRHANANNVNICIQPQSSQLNISIIDDGKGFQSDPSKSKTGKHTGLVTIEERVTLFGGDVNISSKPGQGTEVSINIPLLEEYSYNVGASY